MIPELFVQFDDGLLGLDGLLGRQELEIGKIVVVMYVGVVVAEVRLHGIGRETRLVGERELEVAFEQVVADLQEDQVAYVFALDELRLAWEVLHAECQHIVRVYNIILLALDFHF